MSMKKNKRKRNVVRTSINANGLPAEIVQDFYQKAEMRPELIRDQIAAALFLYVNAENNKRHIAIRSVEKARNREESND